MLQESSQNFEAAPTRHHLKRLALFSGNYNYVMDGPVRALNRLVAYLESIGVEVLVFAPTTEQPAFEHAGTLISVPSLPIPGRSEYRVALGLPARIKQQLQAFNPDLIHLAAPDFLGQAAIRWANKKGIPAVSSFHTRFDTYPRYYKMKWLEPVITNMMRRFYLKCEHVYVPSQSMLEVLRDEGMARGDDSLRLWTRGVDAEVFTPHKRDLAWRRSLGFDDRDTVISFVGRLVLEKGFRLYADVIELLQSRGLPVQALVVGDGPERERFQKRLPSAHFSGFLEGEELARAYASSDIFFNGSVTETFGNVTLEAMASAVPAVCADATGSRTLVADGQSGFLIPDLDKEAFADRIESLVKAPQIRAAMGQESLKRSIPYSWTTVLAKLVTDYEEAILHYHHPKPAIDPVTQDKK